MEAASALSEINEEDAKSFLENLNDTTHPCIVNEDEYEHYSSNLLREAKEASISSERGFKLAAMALQLVKEPTSILDSMLGLASFLHLFSQANAKAYGFGRVISLKFALGTVSRALGRDITSSGATNKSKQDNNEDDAVVEEVEGEESVPVSVRPRRTAAAASHTAGSKAATSRNNQRRPSQPVLVTALLSCLPSLLQAYYQDEELVTLCADLLLALACHQTIALNTKPSWLKELYGRGFLSAHGCSLLSFHQSLLPILSLQSSHGHGQQILQSLGEKARQLCHAALLDVYLDSLSVLLAANDSEVLLFSQQQQSSNQEQSAEEPVAAVTAELNESSVVMEEDDWLDMAAAAATNSTTQALPTQPTALPLSAAQQMVVGFLQRLLLSCPDRAAPRALLAKSITRLLLACNQQQQQERGQSVLNHLLCFLTKLTRCSKVFRRAFALEIVCRWLELSTGPLTSKEELDEEEAEEEGLMSSSSSNGKTEQQKQLQLLFEICLGRCEDASAIVRLKALSSLCEVIQQTLQLQPHSRRRGAGDNNNKKTQQLLQIVQASLLGSSHHGSKGLLETVRLMTQGDNEALAAINKPSIRCKAIQLFALLLSMAWPRGGGGIGREPSSNSSSREVVEEETYLLHLASEDMSAVAQGCKDSASIAVRKQAATSLTSLLLAHAQREETSAATIEALALLWLQSLLPLVLDPEASIVRKVAQLLSSTIFEQLSPATSSLGWQLLLYMSQQQLLPLFKTLLAYCMQQGLLSFDLKQQQQIAESSSSFYGLFSLCTATVQREQQQTATNINSSSSIAYTGAWILLEAFASQASLRITCIESEAGSTTVGEHLQRLASADFAVACLQRALLQQQSAAIDSDIDDEEQLLRILRVLEKMTAGLSKEQQSYLVQETEQRLQSFACSTALASCLLSLRYELSLARAAAAKASKGERGLQQEISVWLLPLVQRLHEVLTAFLLPAASNKTSSSSSALSSTHSSLQTALFLLGELSMLGFRVDEAPRKVRLQQQQREQLSGGGVGAVAATVAAQLVEEIAVTMTAAEASSSGSSNQSHSTTSCCYSLRISFSSRLVDLAKLYVGTTLPSRGEEEEEERSCPSEVRAVAFITLGKLAMRDHSLARSCLNLFLREITTPTATGSSVSSPTSSSTVAVRNNALLVLADLCVRHTHLVDRHLDSLASCLQDEAHMIRRNALVLISQLIMQDYIKAHKGWLLYRLLILAAPPPPPASPCGYGEEEDEEELALACFARDILSRHLAVKYPGLLLNHISETFLVLNKCLEHPVYAAIGAGESSIDDSSTAAASNNSSHSAFSFSQQLDNEEQEQLQPSSQQLLEDSSTASFHGQPATSLCRSQRLAIYDFMLFSSSTSSASSSSDQELLGNEESKIQVTAKLVHDLLASAVDHAARLLPDRSLNNNNQQAASSAASSSMLSPFETAIEDVLIWLRSPSLKVGSSKKRSAAAASSSSSLEEEELPMTGTAAAAAAVGNNSSRSAALLQAKAKILQTLSSQHLVSHVLPVVMSLKHILERRQSPLQGALSEYLCYLVQHFGAEVQQVFAFDPTLQAEVEFDLRQFERQRKEAQQLQQQHRVRSAAAAAAALSATKQPQQVKKVGTTMSTAADQQQGAVAEAVSMAAVAAAAVARLSAGKQQRLSTSSFSSSMKKPVLVRSSSASSLSASKAAVAIAAAAWQGPMSQKSSASIHRSLSVRKLSPPIIAGPVNAAGRAEEEEEEDDIQRLSQEEERLSLQQGLVLSAQKNSAMKPAGPGSSSQGRRRSWGVVVHSLPTGSQDTVLQQQENQAAMANQLKGGTSRLKTHSSSPAKKKLRRSSDSTAVSRSPPADKMAMGHRGGGLLAMFAKTELLPSKVPSADGMVAVTAATSRTNIVAKKLEMQFAMTAATSTATTGGNERSTSRGRGGATGGGLLSLL